MEKKKVIYQVMARLFGNTKTNNIPWGTPEENGLGKFADFTDTALAEIRDLGATHIWYTGVLHHALIRDYTGYGITNDHPDVVKGRAGSPYAVKDYYNVNPDLATDPARRLEEFKELLDRSHRAGLKVIMDLVPNHVARKYQGIGNPPGVADFGAGDDTSVTYHVDNNFYYIPGQAFQRPQWRDGYLPLGGEPFEAPEFEEYPAKWTGNGARSAQPDFHDWYETVKINFGVRPDGTHDFDPLPQNYAERGPADHLAFWTGRKLPDSWGKFRDIALYWLDFGVDGFRFDMAEMVPVEFWSYLNSHIKVKRPDALLLAEVYQPDRYRPYIHLGKMDYLYDKVDFYDGLKHIMKGYGWTDHLPVVQKAVADIEHHMLHFLENHDEERIASGPFAGDPEPGRPAMVVSATMGTSPIMVYFGQEVGEPGAEDAGFGKPSRTSIFDYIGVPHHQWWMNDKKFDGGQLPENLKVLRNFYKKLLNFCRESEALMGAYTDLHFHNKEHSSGYDHRLLSYARWSAREKLIVIANFDTAKSYSLDLSLPGELIGQWDLRDGEYPLVELLQGKRSPILKVGGGQGVLPLQLDPLESLILRL